MKFITTKLALLFLIFLTSCGSDELTKSKAENIIRECEEQMGKKAIKTIKLNYGLVEVGKSFSTRFDYHMKQYIKYREMGLVTIDTLPTVKGSYGSSTEYYQIKLTTMD